MTNSELPQSSTPSINLITCDHIAACHVERLNDEEFYVEALDEQVADELDAMTFSADLWSLMSKNVSTYIDHARARFEAYDAGRSGSRDDRRGSGRTHDSAVTQRVAKAHNTAILATGSGLLEDVYTDDLLRSEVVDSKAVATISSELLKSYNERVSAVNVDRTFAIEEALTTSFQFEFITRAYMQYINQTAPEVLQAIFDPSSVTDLPISLQRIASLDIRRGIGKSVLLDNASKYAPGNQSRSVELAEYINGNHLSESLRSSLISVKLGMQVMGAPDCPFNNLGICTHLLSRLPNDKFPDEIQRDRNSKLQTAAKKRMDGLVILSKRNAVSKILDSTIELNDAYDFSESRSKKRSPAIKLEKRDFQMVDQVEEVAPSFSKIKFRFPNSDVTYEILNNLSEEMMEDIGELFDEKIIKKYVETHHDDKLDSLLMHALSIIAAAPTYAGTDRMITPWLDMKNKAHINEEGVKERFMRFSGSKAVGVSPGQIGKNTRIIFSQGTANGVRHITIHKVIHKADVKTKMTF